MAYFPEHYGKTLIPAILDILDGKASRRWRGGRSRRTCSRPHELVNKDNIRDVYPETPPCS